MEKREKKGQVTIFIIFGIVVVTVILGLVFLMDRGAETTSSGEVESRGLVEGCVRDIVEDSLVKMMKNGGEISPWQSILYKNERWAYLCYQADFYQGCYNLHPMLELQIEKEIERDTSVGVQGCFNAMREDLEGRGFSVSGGATEYSIDLLPGYVAVKLKKDIQISGEDDVQKFSDFNDEIVSPIYDLARVARDIVNSESQFCHFEYNGYMLLYPKYDIRRVDYQDSKMYRVIDRRSGAEFKFAVRSCAFAPGI
jgi:hypothetical protein